MTDRVSLFISTPLEGEHVARIRAVAPEQVEVVHEPDLLPPTRFVADHGGSPDFRRTAEQDRRWRRHLGAAQVLFDLPPVVADDPPFRSLIPNVRWIQTTSSGVGQKVHHLGLHETEVVVTTARGVHAEPLAEFVFMALLSHVKRLEYLKSEQRAHRWERYCGDGLAGRTLAIIGVGEIGRRVAAIGRAFRMRVLAMNAVYTVSRATDLGVDVLYPPSELHAMLAAADVLVLSMPHTPETERMIDAAALAALKPGAMLVNVARGTVVDEPALIEALRNGHLDFAALDVTLVEPLPDKSPLWDLPNVLISPHSASTVAQENQRITDIFCHNLRCWLDGRRADMRNVLDKARLY